MRIADVTEFYSPRGGVRTQLTLKGRGLRGLGHDHLVIAPGNRNDAYALEPQDHGPGSTKVVLVKGPTLPYDSNYQLLWRIDRVRRVLCDFRPEIINANSLYMTALALRATRHRLDAVRVATWHADFVDCYLHGALSRVLRPKATQQITDRIWSLVRGVLNGFAATFVASRTQGKKLESRGVERVIVIPYGVDTTTFHPGAADRELDLELRGGDPNTLLLVAVGRLAGEKNWDLLLDAIARVKTRRNLRLVIFGDGPEGDRLQIRAPASRVTFMGFEPDRKRLAGALASADLFVHAAPHETYAFGVAEAIACGVPVLVSNGGAALDLVDESHATVCDSTSVSAYVAAIERMTGPELPRYHDNALLAAHGIPDSNCQVQAVVRAYADLVKEVRLASG